MSIGNRVYLKRPMPDAEIVKALGQIPAANIADTMGRSCALNPRIQAVFPTRMHRLLPDLLSL